MADILIKGWVMPKCCTTEETVECVFAYTNFGEDYMCLLTGEDLKEGKRGKRCPLLEVKSHGRLIDADVLKATLRIGLANASAFLKGQYKELANKLTDDICLDIDDAPTVLEASNGK